MKIKGDYLTRERGSGSTLDVGQRKRRNTVKRYYIHEQKCLWETHHYPCKKNMLTGMNVLYM